MFKTLFLIIAAMTSVAPAFAQTETQSLSAEDMLTKYTNARALCARITDPFTLYERGMLLISDANEDSYLAAAECFMGAAVRNHTESQIELGYLYEKGNGVVQSNIFAYKWYQTAVLLGNENAVPYRDNLEKVISLDDITAALPMVQKTLTLIEAYTEKQEAELKEQEERIAALYRDKFNINLSEYDVQEIVTTTRKQDFLLDNSGMGSSGKKNKNKDKKSNQKKDSRRRTSF